MFRSSSRKPHGQYEMDQAAQLLVLAQQTADAAIADAQPEAEQMIASARPEEEQIIPDAQERAAAGASAGEESDKDPVPRCTRIAMQQTHCLRIPHLAAKRTPAEWVAARRGTLSASSATPYQGSRDEQTPDQEPWIPQVGMPSQGAVVGVPWRRDDTRLDEQSGGSQHQAIGGQDQCLNPGQSPQPSLPP